MLTELEDESFSDELAPKVHGAQVLSDITSNLTISVCHVLVGSRNLGRQSQSAYAAANAFLDSLAEKRRYVGVTNNIGRLGTVGWRRHGDRPSASD
ncbi:KR domain-containing protein (plasmid) [Mycobacterium ulcerans]|nr:KR domain-containing protein [Mycobacterium ulcerans]